MCVGQQQPLEAEGGCPLGRVIGSPRITEFSGPRTGPNTAESGSGW
jgi:hypothetical protein